MWNFWPVYLSLAVLDIEGKDKKTRVIFLRETCTYKYLKQLYQLTNEKEHDKHNLKSKYKLHKSIIFPATINSC